MPNFAIIDSSKKIVNVIVADSLEIAQLATGAECVELPELGFGIGDLYDGTNFVRYPESVEKLKEI